MSKKLLTVLVLLFFVAVIGGGQAAYAAEYSIDSGTTSAYNLNSLSNGDVLKINTAEYVELKKGNSKDITIICTVENVNIKLNKVKITTTSASPITFTGLGNELAIKGACTLNAPNEYAAVNVNEGVSLKIKGGGTLTANGGENGAGIGSSKSQTSGQILIVSGIIKAYGGTNAAGIGGTSYRDGYVTIEGGNITAVGGTNAAGIGGGNNANGHVVISGGTITLAKGGWYGAGIGGGSKGKDSSVEIKGGTIKNATTVSSAAGIGSGYYGDCEIKILKGNITATGGAYGAAIGSGSHGDSEVTIEGGTIKKALGGSKGAGIGSGDFGDSTVVIKGGVIKNATGGANGAGIGSGYHSDADVTIEDGTVTLAKGGENGAGIGSGKDSDAYVTIKDGKAKGVGGADGAGIGSGESSDVTVLIKGGTVTNATGGADGAGIGFGDYGAGSVTIEGGTITYAKGGADAPGIGAGENNDGDPVNCIISITDGTIKKAQGAVNGAGIGGGKNSSCAVSISGGLIKESRGGKYAAGIGGGRYSSFGEVNISGGEIYARKGSNCPNDVGGGKNGTYSGTNISGSAAVFGYNKKIKSVSTATHVVVNTDNIASQSAYGFDYFPSTWGTRLAYGYLAEVTVTFNENYDDVKTTATAYKGGKVTEPDDPSRAGYDFDGWYKEIGCTNAWIFADDKVWADTNIYAKWSARSDTEYKVEHYKQNLDDDLYTLCETDALTGTTDTTVNAVAKIYAGFSEDAEHLERIASGTVTGDGKLVLKLYYNRDMYTVSFDSKGGSDVADIENVKHGATILEPNEPEKQGYSFGGWHKEDACTNAWTFACDKVEANATLYAKWDADSDTEYKVEHYKQNLDDDLYTLAETEVLGGTTDTTVNAVAKIYVGFSENAEHPERIASGTISADNSLVLKLYYDRETYTVSFDSKGGSDVADITGVKYGALVAEPDAPNWLGNTFNGWHIDTTCTQPFYFDETPITADITLYAHWIASDTYNAELKGSLTCEDGCKAQEYKVVLQSRPIECTTCSCGMFDFGIVFYESHTLIIKNPSGNVLKTYRLSFTEGSKNAYTINETAGTINLFYTGNTVSIDIPLKLNSSETTTEVDGEIIFSETESEQVSNPRTGDK